MSQRDDALALANERRSANALLKRDIAAGNVEPWLVLMGEVRYEVADKMRVRELLTACPGIGNVTAEQIMKKLGLTADARLRDLSQTRRRQLAAATWARRNDRRGTANGSRG